MQQFLTKGLWHAKIKLEFDTVAIFFLIMNMILQVHTINYNTNVITMLLFSIPARKMWINSKD